MPFARLSDYQLEFEFSSDKATVKNRFKHSDIFDRVEYGIDDPESANFIDCSYYDNEDFNERIRQLNIGLSVFHMNIKKLSKHRGALMAYMSSLKLSFDIIILSEIGKDACHYMSSVFQGYSCTYKLPKDNAYGGVAIFTSKNDIVTTERDVLAIEKTCACPKCVVEDVWLQCTKNNETIIVGGVYRHPNGNTKHFTSDLERSLSKLTKNETCIIGGDMNINLMNSENLNAKEYLTTMYANNFLPYITRPTRITEQTATAIDHLFFKTQDKKLDCPIISGILFNDITDHLPNFLLLPQKDRINKTCFRPKIRVYSEQNIRKFVTEINQIQWDQCLDIENRDTNKICDIAMGKIDDKFNQCFPWVKISRSRAKDQPWITSSIRQRIQQKNKLYRKYENIPSSNNESKYKQHKRLLDKSLKNIEKEYYSNIFKDKYNSANALWKHFGQILGGNKGRNSSNVTKLKVGGTILTDPSDIANTFNEFFCTIGENLANKIERKKDDPSYKIFLNKEPQVKNSFFISPVTDSDVLEELLKLDPNKSAGPDELRPKIIKASAYGLAKPLSIIFNSSIETGIYPKSFKLAKVIPVYKSEGKSTAGNYRPINLLNCFNKVFEKLIHKQLMGFLQKHKALSIYQYAFRKNLSSVLALIEIVDGIKQSLDEGNYVIGLYLDLKKAFDTIDHTILINKLSHYGARGHALQFFPELP